MKTYKILGIVEEGVCEHCGANCPRRRVAVDTPDGVERWGVVCAAKVTRRSSTSIVNAAESADFARRQAEHFATRDREARVAWDKTMANYRYQQTRRPLPGSFLAARNGVKFARVDGSDPVDVSFYADRGFVAVTVPVKAELIAS